MNIINVTEKNVAEVGFFCKMSQKKSEAWKRKLQWIQPRFSEGLRIKMLDLSEGGRGFIEYIPGEYAWRTLNAEGYMVIHCIWVVGKSKGNGYAAMLLKTCMDDAKKMGLPGVAMVTSEKVGLVTKKFLLRHGFESVDKVKPSFELLVKRFKKTAAPSFPNDWEERRRAFGEGMTIIGSGQCPYNVNAAKIAREVAGERGVSFTAETYKSHEDVQKYSPSPYGVFNIMLDGKLVSNQHVTKKGLLKLMPA
ncbi:MAG: GNAT family N-acetyltransferase, partial [Desulfobacterales bacterium]|nr:GNAT family N-acetyltransferase [Desulfobacterales bacterium]